MYMYIICISLSIISQISDIIEKYSVWRCYDVGTRPFVLDIIIFVYLGLLQFVGIILAFQTRKVNITALNDSKAIAILIYISSIVLVVIVLITFILRSYINVSAAMFSGGILVLATFFLVLIFIPKVSDMSCYNPYTYYTVATIFYEACKIQEPILSLWS